METNGITLTNQVFNIARLIDNHKEGSSLQRLGHMKERTTVLAEESLPAYGHEIDRNKTAEGEGTFGRGRGRESGHIEVNIFGINICVCACVLASLSIAFRTKEKVFHKLIILLKLEIDKHTFLMSAKDDLKEDGQRKNGARHWHRVRGTRGGETLRLLEVGKHLAAGQVLAGTVVVRHIATVIVLHATEFVDLVVENEILRIKSRHFYIIKDIIAYLLQADVDWLGQDEPLDTFGARGRGERSLVIVETIPVLLRRHHVAHHQRLLGVDMIALVSVLQLAHQSRQLLEVRVVFAMNFEQNGHDQNALTRLERLRDASVLGTVVVHEVHLHRVWQPIDHVLGADASLRAPMKVKLLEGVVLKVDRRPADSGRRVGVANVVQLDRVVVVHRLEGENRGVVVDKVQLQLLVHHQRVAVNVDRRLRGTAALLAHQHPIILICERVGGDGGDVIVVDEGGKN